MLIFSVSFQIDQMPRRARKEKEKRRKKGAVDVYFIGKRVACAHLQSTQLQATAEQGGWVANQSTGQCGFEQPYCGAIVAQC